MKHAVVVVSSQPPVAYGLW